MNNNLRYTVGQDYLFIRIKFTNNPGDITLTYVPWRCEHHTIEFIKLKCTQHHKVPGNWDDDPRYDGFSFIDDVDRIWHNQFPRAGYNKTDDSMDGQVSLAVPDEEDTLFTTHWVDALRLLLSIKHDEKYGGHTHAEARMLKQHRHDIQYRIHDRYGCSVVYYLGDPFRYDKGSKIRWFRRIRFEPSV